MGLRRHVRTRAVYLSGWIIGIVQGIPRTLAGMPILRPPSGISLRKRDPLSHCPTNPGEHGWASVPSRRHASSLDLSLGSVFPTPRVFTTSRVFAGPVFAKCLRARARARAHVASQRHVSSPHLSSGNVCACPRVFATLRVFAGPVFGKRLHLPTCLRDATCLCRTCLRDVSSLAHVSSLQWVPSPM